MKDVVKKVYENVKHDLPIENLKNITTSEGQFDFTKFVDGSELIMFGKVVGGNSIDIKEVIDVTRKVDYITTKELKEQILNQALKLKKIDTGTVVLLVGIVVVGGVGIYFHLKSKRRNKEIQNKEKSDI